MLYYSRVNSLFGVTNIRQLVDTRLTKSLLRSHLVTVNSYTQEKWQTIQRNTSYM